MYDLPHTIKAGGLCSFPHYSVQWDPRVRGEVGEVTQCQSAEMLGSVYIILCMEWRCGLVPHVHQIAVAVGLAGLANPALGNLHMLQREGEGEGGMLL